ncbi:MAG: hypothetical protein HY319_22275 [Armatimonadetes bacterium]|nr:hypothetical protein [Armatimonadota bacterium]
MANCACCGGVLPKIMQPTANAGFEKRLSRFNQFREAGEKARSGEWSPGEYGEWLRNISGLLAQKTRYLIWLYESTPGYYESSSDEVDMGISGIQDYEESMEIMWGFVEDGQTVHIDQGLQLMWEGNEKINEAMRLNREFRRRLEEEAGFW